MFVGSEACAAKVKVNVTTPWTRAWQANGGYFGMFAEVSTGSSCATIVTETAATNQSRILRRVVIGASHSTIVTRPLLPGAPAKASKCTRAGRPGHTSNYT